MSDYTVLITVGFVGVVVLLLSSFAYGMIDVLSDHGKIKYKHVDMGITTEEIHGAMQLVGVGVAVVTILMLLSALTFHDSILMNPDAPNRLAILLECSVIGTWLTIVLTVPALHYKKLRKV